MNHSSKKAIVIGSGIAGMAAAIRLAVQGFQVSVYEANGYPGGKLSSFEKNGYLFDAGPSLFTQPENIEALFAYANEPIQSYFQYKKVDVSCNYFFENGKCVIAYADKEKLFKEFSEKLGEDAKAIKKYLVNAEKLYNNVGSVFLNHSLHKPATWLHRRVFKAIRATKLSYLFNSLHTHNKKHFVSSEATQIFNRFATYNGSNPYKAPSMLSLIPHLEQNQGTYYPKGGMISITNALYQLAQKKGVTFHFNHKVVKILHNSKSVKGIVVNGIHILADIIVSNGDVYYTYKYLLNLPSQTKKIEQQERSSSALIFYWGIKKEFSSLGLHNILFSDNYENEFEHIFIKKELSTDPTIYINVTSKMEKGQAPDGNENWFVMINAPNNVGQDWPSMTTALRAMVVKKINRILQTDIESHIDNETIMDPVIIEEKTGTYMGALYGTSSNSPLAAFLRPSNFSKKIQGLYFCGGTVHPGGGIPLCLQSAAITTEIINKEHAQ